MKNRVIEPNEIIKGWNQAILESLHVGIVIYDSEARQEYMNDVAFTLFGVVDKEAHLAKHVSLFEDPMVDDEIVNMVRRGEQINVVIDYNMRIATYNAYIGTKMNQILFLDTKVRYIKNHEGKIEKYILILEDVTLKRLQELQSSSKILSISMNALKAFTWFCDIRDSILRFGEGFEKFGTDPAEMDSMIKFAQKIHPNYRQMFIDFIEDFSKRESGDFSIEYEIDLNNSGNYEWWESRGVIEVVKLGKYSYKYLYGIDINIDKFKRNELDLIKNKTEMNMLNKQNHIILNNTNSGLAFIDNDYVVQWENLSSFMPNHPLTRNYRQGCICYKAVKNLDCPCSNCVVERSYISGKIEIKEIEFGEFFGELTATPIFDEEHNRIGTVLKTLDITEKKRVQRDIMAAKNHAEAANKLMQEIINYMPCILFIKDVDDDFKHIIVNQYFCKVVGIKYEDVLGKTDYDIFPTKEAADKCRRDDMIPIETGKIHMYEEETFFEGNHIIWQTTKICMKDSDGRRLLIAMSLDITSKVLAYNELQKAKEAADELNRLKSAFLANMSHEIRTPLNAIVGFSGLMIEATSDVEKSEYFNIINVNNDLLLRLVNDILDLSKIEAGMIQLKPVKFDMANLFKDLTTMFEMRIINPNVKFITESPYRKCIVHFDKDRLTQVITNFMTNAIKFTTQGEIVMGYSYFDGALRVYVQDTGIGIAKDKLNKVFERFEKLDNFAQGTGLGMAISKAVAEICNGKIGVESNEGIGSTFWFSVPIKADLSL